MVCQIDSTRVEGTYTLTEHVENDGHHRKRGKGGEEFDVADIRKTGEGEVLQGEDCCQVSCHCEEDEDKLTPRWRGIIKQKNQSYHCHLSAYAERNHPGLIDPVRSCPFRSEARLTLLRTDASTFGRLPCKMFKTVRKTTASLYRQIETCGLQWAVSTLCAWSLGYEAVHRAPCPLPRPRSPPPPLGGGMMPLPPVNPPLPPNMLGFPPRPPPLELRPRGPPRPRWFGMLSLVV